MSDTNKEKEHGQSAVDSSTLFAMSAKKPTDQSDNSATLWETMRRATIIDPSEDCLSVKISFKNREDSMRFVIATMKLAEADLGIGANSGDQCGK